LHKGTVYDILAALAACLVLLLSLLYVYFYPEFDATTLLVGVIFPLLFGCIVLAARKNWVFLFAFIAYFWSLVDDKPVQFDSVLTWPEVTRFNPAGPHIFMEIVLHALTIAFLYLAIREALKGTNLNASKAFKVSVLTFVAFGLSYAQNIPLAAIQAIVPYNWYPIDLLEHIASLAFLYFAVREAEKDPVKPT
jgi:hypothetical protein